MLRFRHGNECRSPSRDLAASTIIKSTIVQKDESRFVLDQGWLKCFHLSEGCVIRPCSAHRFALCLKPRFMLDQTPNLNLEVLLTSLGLDFAIPASKSRVAVSAFESAVSSSLIFDRLRSTSILVSFELSNPQGFGNKNTRRIEGEAD